MGNNQDIADAKAVGALLGHSFQDPDLIIEALTHPSSEAAWDYQRLEFLGDRVLGLVTVEALFETFPLADEGSLTRRYNNLVCNETLADIAVGIALGPLIRMAPAMEKSGGRVNRAILADVLEALIGALHLDGGYTAARQAIRSLWAPRLLKASSVKDAKTELQEWLQSRGHGSPIYSIVRRKGLDHAPTFTVRVETAELGAAKGSGTSRKAAEFAAAEALLIKLGGQEGGG